MAVGRRGRRSERAKLDATPPDWQQERTREEAAPTTGPWDEVDAPDDGFERLDLGALRIPVLEGVEVRVDVSPEGQVAAATLTFGGSEMQIGVFAAPRNAGIWDEVRKEIRGSIAAQGGTAQDERGRWGIELTARVPVQGGYQMVRFVGLDGPRWFLRALFTGPGATDPVRAAALEDALRNIVVVRGSEPMPVRDPLPLRLPKEIAEQAAEGSGIPGLAAQAGGSDLTAAGSAGTPPAAGGHRDPGAGGAPSRRPARGRRRR